MTNINKSVGLFVLAFIIITYSVAYFFPRLGEAATVIGNDYNATTTFAALAVGEKILIPGHGSLGSVIVTGPNTGKMFLYNATTTNVNFRSPLDATSTILIAEIPASAPAETYTYDVEVKGLILVTEGLAPTSTITFRY